MFKPFKPPASRSVARPAPTEDRVPDSPPPAKRRKLLSHVIEDSPPKKTIAPASSGVLAPRKPLIPVKNPVQAKPVDGSSSECPENYYMVLWRKYTTKKHKTWDGDGVLSVYGGYAHLQDVSGREMGRCMFKDPLLPGSTLSVGGKDVEVDSIITKADFLAGRPFLNNTALHPSTPASLPKVPITLPKGKMSLFGKKREDASELEEIPAQNFYATSKSDAMKAHFKNPLLSTTIMPQNQNGSPTPRHDPNAPGALVMKRPKDCPKGKQIVDVVLDPFLTRHLHEHQREGIQFLYECVMGLRNYDGRGALLADEMGLGKTLQTICLLWTLLKQNPICGSDPVIKKALIVCPVTLIENWKAEFRKWLGNERIGVFIEDGQGKKKITDFTHGKSYSVMIIGYERLRSVQADLKKGAGIDIIFADEGHRLKTASNKSAQAILNLNTDRRVILSGTPMQNDLSEFFTMVDFINPGLLGKYSTFKKEFEGPILKSRQPAASSRDIEKGAARGEELSELTKEFILRRTADLLAKYLKSKTEYVVFCKPTQAQAEVYQHIIGSPFFGKALGASESSLQLITILKKVCNAPSLLKSKEDAPSNPVVAALLDVIPPEIMHKSNVNASAKFRVLDKLLKTISRTTSEKVVIVSNYTSTLELIGEHLTSMSLSFLRLDGKTPQKQRQGLVDRFNKSDASNVFAFLLSAKSGGSGLNLIGASRLFLFDVDWNPATDQQAMARIHRHGQKRPVKIYRLVLAGGMDEKIYQRQVTKTGLADSVVDGKRSEGSFSPEELRDLFRLDMSDGCQTHQLLGCECKGVGADLAPPPDVEPDLPSALPVHDLEDSDDDLLFPTANAIVSGTQANVAAVEKKFAEDAKKKKSKRSEGKMQALMMYRHIDTSVFRGETEDVFGYQNEDVKKAEMVLDDKMLAEVLKEDNCKINYIFAKRDRAVEAKV
ncbi:probable RDH54 Protein required for mitotic diploid-specific recombination and repair and meiosis [Rhynchosporium secalis]|uniref:Probable RDH54 Protein required for mitotic diploid-specific recombination and repair and meiosis n=1 Tax=Rhynchosporium secalis TaxID=38038 RepID=A0A1E1ML21_RHYSE|nr:probable RDH54 Protein required for mitotic diploid-specific recombination and repair and meiosis [Rhynchosporium secalis]